MNRTATFLLPLILLSILALAALLSGSRDQGLPPRFAPPALAFLHRFDNADDPGSTFLSVGFRLDSESRFEVAFNESATWTDSNVYWIQDELLTFAQGRVAPGNFEASEADTTCDASTAHGSLGECRRTTLEQGGPGRFGSTLRPGTYVAQVMAFGADRARISLTLSFAADATILWRQTGGTRLLAMEPVDDASPQLQAASTEIGTPFFARFRTGGSNGAAFRLNATREGEGPPLTFVSSAPRASSQPDHYLRPVWLNLEQNETMYGPAFAGAK
ncbi:MAG: hypothetical protein LC623_03010, partial [Halobacteriales archaeon]|nr:hypothetical protein [Halobacteriales archaeon]